MKKGHFQLQVKIKCYNRIHHVNAHCPFCFHLCFLINHSLKKLKGLQTDTSEFLFSELHTFFDKWRLSGVSSEIMKYWAGNSFSS